MNEADSTATPLLLLGETRRRSIEARLIKCWRAWRREWNAVPEADGVVELAPLMDGQAVVAGHAACCAARGRVNHVTSIYVLASGSGLLTALGLPPAFSGWNGGAFASHVAGEMTASVARAVLLEAQYPAAQIDIAPIEPSDVASTEPLKHWWCAAVAGMTLLLAPHLLASLAPTRKTEPMTAPDKRRAAIADETIKLEAVLGQAQVSVGELSSLRVNDVVVLTGSLTQPGQLTSRGGRHVATVSLGRVEGKRAVVIVKRSS